MLKEYLSRIANAFRSVLDTSEKINAQDFPDKVSEVYEAGKQAQSDEFWDGLQKGGTEYMYYGYAFANKDIWTQENIEKVKYKNLKANYFSVVFTGNTSITDLSMFTIVSATKLGLSSTFASCSNLKKCMPIDCDMVYNFASAFNNCTALKELMLSGTLLRSGLDLKWSKKLSKKSIESIIRVLSTTASGQTVILSQTAVDKAFETSDGANDGSTSAEWYNLVNSRLNWTIALTEVQ